MYRFRHQIFKERLGWQIPSRGSLEWDSYDELDPVYGAYYRRGAIIGAFRLLPTTGPYMLRDIFAELLRGEPPPCAADVWELSRFAVTPVCGDSRAQLTCSEDMFEVLRACYDFSCSNGIRQLVLVTSVAVERMLRGVRVPLVRLGDGRPTQLDKVLSVACRVAITDELYEVLHPLCYESALEGAA
ncbi:Autoinducer synthesis protein [Nitrococcus mobilis Nb-231]|uniref:Acyl-homoserine-lactone synthase n=1 Tax=Nitrococcus mobilis Nb-231 TaxID=314278 RepID=A4BSD4_9GAMM|nr:Autoinducer synthesis protein [Nitrococcus mobilis Nb-231]